MFWNNFFSFISSANGWPSLSIKCKTSTTRSLNGRIQRKKWGILGFLFQNRVYRCLIFNKGYCGQKVILFRYVQICNFQRHFGCHYLINTFVLFCELVTVVLGDFCPYLIQISQSWFIAIYACLTWNNCLCLLWFLLGFLVCINDWFIRRYLWLWKPTQLFFAIRFGVRTQIG